MAGDDKNTPATPQATILVPGSGTAPGVGASSASRPDAGAARPDAPRTIQIGDVLNNIFEVKRFIARGGMGEVFEGINVASDERVAIKVMLPSMASDEKFLALFRKEARTLTRLNHPALVQYRVLAQEPQLGVFYIVTEFVDGRNLSDVIGEIESTPKDLLRLTRRLASGLQAAHALGAIHRDMSPDNIMLEDGLLSGARIIDFGVAKDLNAGTATIIGDGFAGKLNYVAPEQLGDFDREIGPWTDIYSLGLVILAVAARRDVDMGTTLVNAVDRRRAGPDLSQVPEELRRLLGPMLTANPAQRLRSMSDLLDLIATINASLPDEGPAATLAAEQSAAVPGAEAPPEPAVAPTPAGPAPVEAAPVEAPPVESPPVEAPAAEAPPAWPEPVTPEPTAIPATPPQVADPAPIAAPAAAAPVAAPPSQPIAPAQPQVAKSGGSPLPQILGAVAALLLLSGAAVWYFVFAGKKQDSVLQSDAADAVAVSDETGAINAALGAGLPSIGCTWLDVAGITGPGGSQTVALRGVAGKPDEAKGEIAKLLAAKNLKVSAIDFQQVAPIEATECTPLDALRQIRDTSASRMLVEQRQIEITKQTSGAYAGSLGAKAVVDFNLGDPNQEMSLFGIEPSGKISQLTSERSELVGASDDVGGNRYRLSIDVNHTGWSGFLLLTGQKPFDSNLLSGAAGSRTGDWAQRFLTVAKERGWKAEMVWFKTVDDQPN